MVDEVFDLVLVEKEVHWVIFFDRFHVVRCGKLNNVGVLVLRLVTHAENAAFGEGAVLLAVVRSLFNCSLSCFDVGSVA